MDKLILVAAGGATGAVLRYLAGVGSTRMLGTHWPWGTFLVNVAGGLAMGLLVGTLAHRGGADQERWRLLLGVGLLGGFTTFSAFSLEVALMFDRKEWPTALGYSTASVAASVIALFAGLALARRLVAG